MVKGQVFVYNVINYVCFESRPKMYQLNGASNPLQRSFHFCQFFTGYSYTAKIDCRFGTILSPSTTVQDHWVFWAVSWQIKNTIYTDY